MDTKIEKQNNGGEKSPETDPYKYGPRFMTEVITQDRRGSIINKSF